MTTTRFAVPAAVAAAALAVLLSGCVPEPASSPAPSGSTAPASASAAPSEAPTETPAAGLPADCADVYTADLRATLEGEGLPLNDPGITMYSTQNATLLELLDTVPTLRCTWGAPGEVGLATNVSLIDAGQSATVSDALAAAGFGCEDADGATICRIEQRGVTLEDAEYVRGETHALRGDLWIATGWLNLDPEGYTEDILATLAR
jgi:hypothetical protein